MASMCKWGVVAGLDNRQKKTFKVIVAAFLLTFHEFNQGLWQFIFIAHSLLPCTANKTKTTLKKGNSNPQLIMMLHSMGRSRKRALPLFWLMPWNIAKFSKHPICTIAITAVQ
jgi:hypothetical protein